jgi:glucose/arabinose dehydrogenase
MLERCDRPLSNNNTSLRWQTAVTARIGLKSFFAALANRQTPEAWLTKVIDSFVVNDSVWARPVGVAVAHDGALLVSQDGNGTM